MRRLTALALAASVALPLGACATPLPEPEPEAVPAVAPAVLTSEQLDRVLTDLETVLADADGAGLAAGEQDDPEAAVDAAVLALEPRVFGPAATIRRAQYVLAGEVGEDAVTVIPDGAQTVIEPATTQWPRVVMLVTEAPEDLQAPMLLTLVQDDPRSDFRMWSWQRLFGGVQMPATMLPEVGSDPVPADGGTAVATPEEVIDHYVDLVTRGTKSDYVDDFAESPLRVRIAEQRKAWKAAVGEGSLAETYTPLEEGPFALSTADGGSIVVAGFETVTTMTLADSTLKVADDATAALLGKDTITKNLSLTWTATVAFSVPPEGSDDPITVLGAEYVLVEAKGK